MSKWFGKLGFVETKETELSVHSEIVTERDCYGDLTRNMRRLQSGDKVNDDISLANTLSVIADPYVHLAVMRRHFAIMSVGFAAESLMPSLPLPVTGKVGLCWG